ncbi:MAG TPA: GNAT family N-acetyltransferase [Stellaceae bacterium]|nr:GNAT family N-acetyltransferase [Stellaceae bacterium]
MHIDVFDKFSEFDALRRNWEAVYEADPEAHFFLSWQWLADWLATHRTIWFILAAKRRATDAEYAAFLPMRMRTEFNKKHGFTNEISFAGSGFSDYAGILTEPQFEAEAAPAFAEYLKRNLNWAEFKMENLTMSDQRRRLFIRAFDKIRFVQNPISYKYPEAPTDHAICPLVNLPGTWEEYLSNLGSSNRQKMRRLLKRIDSSNDYHITVSDSEAMDQNLAALLALWKVKWLPSKGEQKAEDIVNLNQWMLSRCAKNGTLFLPMFWHGDRLVAALATLVDRSKRSLLFFITGRDESYREMPAGYLLHAFSIRHAIAHGFTTYEFLKGNEPYKYLFGPQVERHQKPLSVVTKTSRNLGGKLDPRGLPAMLEMASEFEDKNETADAELGYRQILELAPDNALALYRFGRLKGENGAHIEAKRLLTRSVEVEPEGDNAWFSLAQSLQALGETQAALAAYRQVLKLQPSNKQAKELILQLTVTAEPARQPIAAAHPIGVVPANPGSQRPPIAAAIDPALALQKQVQELRTLTQHYHDAFVNPRPRW